MKNNSPDISKKMKEKIDKFFEYLTKITKYEADFIEYVLSWDDETKIAFKFAKKMFDETVEKDS